VITNFKDKDKERIGPVTVSMMDAREEAAAIIKKNSSTSGKNATDKSSVKLKPALFFSCRVHPGEPPASWMMKGILDFLTSDTSQAHLLRQNFVIYIVPVLNPDGVIYGNNRCCLAGVDLNRQWKIPLKVHSLTHSYSLTHSLLLDHSLLKGLHPTVYHLKNFMIAQRKIRDVLTYIDLHGHSRKYNVFMYGTDDKKKPRPQIRAFPRFFSMHHIGQKYVCFQDCSFHVKKG